MHPWNVSIAEATQIQKEMQRRLIQAPLPSCIRTVAGADISFNRYSDIFHACVVVLTYPGLQIIDEAYATERVTFPYVSGYLSFREVPAIAEAYGKLQKKPDVLVMDGQGIAHPRGIGVASHLGIVIDAPTVGVAKSRLFGEGDEPDEDAGSISYLRHPTTEEPIGAYIRTKARVKPILVSPGHMADVETSIAFVKSLVKKHRIPEPTRLAHELVNAYRINQKDAFHAA